MLADWLSLLKLQGVDVREELELEGCGLESENRLVNVDLTGNICRSSVTCVVSETYMKIKYIQHFFSHLFSIQINIINTADCEYQRQFHLFVFNEL